MKSTIKEIKGVNPWSNDHGQFYAHALIMDNGDKLSISKKKEGAFEVGQELEYDKTKELKAGWWSAKEVAKPFNKSTYKPEPYEHSAARTAMASASSIVASGHVDQKLLFPLADKIYNWMLEKKQG